MFYGESKCQSIVKSTSKPCVQKAYYVDNNQNLCGTHSKKDTRVKLPTNPNIEAQTKMMYNTRSQEIQITARCNRKNCMIGNIIVSKFRMMKHPEYTSGYLNIFPNRNHQNRRDGFGCASLSPMNLGPINHGMPNLPPSLNLENYHQYAKIWSFELDEYGNITEEALKQRAKIYNCDNAYRHKYSKKFIRDYLGKIEPPLYSAHYSSNGVLHKYNYVQSRYFYCHFYELLAKQTYDYKQLIKYRNKGYNLCIVGFDGYNVVQPLYEYYCDTNYIFGHELVLYSLLTIDQAENYPWNRYYQEYPDLYMDVI
jgi:hypothetical protein